MKILHAGDWHLGRQFYGQSLEVDHDSILDQVLGAVRTCSPDVLVIAGDIFDRASPPATAVRQFNSFIRTVHADCDTSIVLIAGNHDSGDRIASYASLADPKRLLIRGPLSPEERPLILEDEYGPVAFSGLPFGNEFSARECYGNGSISCPADVVAAQVACARTHVPGNARWVIAAHVFVANATPSESERSLQIGGIETVPSSVFDGAHYVALGHLHRPQSAGGEHIRYSGSPLAFGFDEAGSSKSLTMVDLAADGSVTLQQLPINPPRAVRVMKGEFEELRDIGSREPSEDFIKLVLTDKKLLIDPMGRIREHYPNALALTYERDESSEPILLRGSSQAKLDDPVAVVGEFLNQVRGEHGTDEEMALVGSALKQLNNVEERA
ncbi:exonuclease SbcCD subunit D C-terminal domain-containing protein [Sinorhizobium medicae]|nr:exonuclease subunit SbcD [Sinorhizobium medicae]MDX0729399.1 exonuclease subunit SbcD [Sinorhizobium medicae]MDX0735585.1 exonuclease subunit SbcD [Sinorhizobium medicae]MDX0815496.1 exonuclease subunit SbcD [Sinorhizobium medicae]MDX1103670.1 exonuclease subunit SbcD [Sinorhizobium medicae]